MTFTPHEDMARFTYSTWMGRNAEGLSFTAPVWNAVDALFTESDIDTSWLNFNTGADLPGRVKPYDHLLTHIIAAHHGRDHSPIIADADTAATNLKLFLTERQLEDGVFSVANLANKVGLTRALCHKDLAARFAKINDTTLPDAKRQAAQDYFVLMHYSESPDLAAGKRQAKALAAAKFAEAGRLAIATDLPTRQQQLVEHIQRVARRCIADVTMGTAVARPAASGSVAYTPDETAARNIVNYCWTGVYAIRRATTISAAETAANTWVSSIEAEYVAGSPRFKRTNGAAISHDGVKNVHYCNATTAQNSVPLRVDAHDSEESVIVSDTWNNQINVVPETWDATNHRVVWKLQPKGGGKWTVGTHTINLRAMNAKGIGKMRLEIRVSAPAPSPPPSGNDEGGDGNAGYGVKPVSSCSAVRNFGVGYGSETIAMNARESRRAAALSACALRT